MQLIPKHTHTHTCTHTFIYIYILFWPNMAIACCGHVAGKRHRYFTDFGLDFWTQVGDAVKCCRCCCCCCQFWPIFALAQKVLRQVTRLRRFNRFHATKTSNNNNNNNCCSCRLALLASLRSRQRQTILGKKGQQRRRTFGKPLESNPSVRLVLGQQESPLPSHNGPWSTPTRSDWHATATGWLDFAWLRGSVSPKKVLLDFITNHEPKPKTEQCQKGAAAWPKSTPTQLDTKATEKQS